jgi:hypothetical protein
MRKVPVVFVTDKFHQIGVRLQEDLFGDGPFVYALGSGRQNVGGLYVTLCPLWFRGFAYFVVPGARSSDRAALRMLRKP